MTQEYNPVFQIQTFVHENFIDIPSPNRIAIWTQNKLCRDATHILLAFYIGKKTRKELKLVQETNRNMLIEESILRVMKKQSIEEQLNQEKQLSARLFARLRI